MTRPKSKETIDKCFKKYLKEKEINPDYFHPIFIAKLKEEFVLGYMERDWKKLKYDAFHSGGRYQSGNE